MTESLKNKTILFIGAKTFNYENEIIKCLQGMGAIVDYYNDRPFESSYKKILLRLVPKLLKKEISQYFLDILDNASKVEYDYVFCLKLECFPREVLLQLREQQQGAKFIFYTWDSFTNNKNPLNCLDVFDRCLTFDNQDATTYGLILRPLFYLDEYTEIEDEKRPFDVSFVGSIHIHRYKLIKSFLKKLDEKYTCYMYLFVPSQLLYFARKTLLFPIYGSSKKTDFKFTSLNKKEIVSLFKKSKAILDICHHNQSGLTMRSIEALGARRKLITNNGNIKIYDFFNPQNILIFDEKNMEISNEFLDSDYLQVSPEIQNRYSLEGWLIEIFDL
jgi:hypothetical protein